MNELIKTIRNITGFRALRNMKDGSIWFKCITNSNIEYNSMLNDINSLVASGISVKCISNETLVTNSKVYTSFKVKAWWL